jgi:hypothetical protein
MALVARLHDVAVVREPVQQRRGHLRVAEHAGPLCEVQVRRDHHAGVLVQLAQRVEQQRPAAGLAEVGNTLLAVAPFALSNVLASKGGSPALPTDGYAAAEAGDERRGRTGCTLALVPEISSTNSSHASSGSNE